LKAGVPEIMGYFQKGILACSLGVRKNTRTTRKVSKPNLKRILFKIHKSRFKRDDVGALPKSLGNCFFHHVRTISLCAGLGAILPKVTRPRNSKPNRRAFGKTQKERNTKQAAPGDGEGGEG
jgi:hypothetical protein